MHTICQPEERILIPFESSGIPEVIMLGRYHYRQAHPQLLAHAHPDTFEMVILARGSQTYHVASKTYTLKGGDVFISKPGEVHETGTEAECKGRLYWLQLRNLKPGASLLGLPPKESQRVMDHFRKLTTHQFTGGDSLPATFERIISLYQDRGALLRHANLQNLLQRLVLDIAEVTTRHPHDVHGSSIRHAIYLIEANFCTRLTNEFLAQSVHMSASHFKACFKRDTGIPPAEYIAQRRMKEARHMLTAPDVNVTEVAHALGFESSQHFATVFKRFTGQSPAAYRRQPATPAPFKSHVVTGTGVRFHPTGQKKQSPLRR